MNYIVNYQSRRKLEAVEDRWGIRPRIVDEWEKTLDTLLEYYNTEDVNSILKSICVETKKACKNDKLSAKELKKWMRPQLEPAFWKQYLWKNKYEEEMQQYNDANKLLFGENDSDLEENDEKLSKQQIIYGIIRELRNGNKMVHSNKLLINNYKYLSYYSFLM